MVFVSLDLLETMGSELSLSKFPFLASITASASAEIIMFIVRIESSFAGIGYVTLFGSVLESTIAIVGISNLLASLIAVSSY